jgi:hypothetical protein
MQQALVIITGFIVSNLVAFTIYTVKGNNKDKIEIMSVRSELKKIDRLNKAEKDSIF